MLNLLRKLSSPLMLLCSVALIVRLYGINFPYTDGGHERQTQVAMIARNLFNDNFNVLYPRLDIFPPGPGYVLLEFPLQPLLMALVYNFFEEDYWIGRGLSILFSVGSIILFYVIARQFFSSNQSIWASLIYAFTPMSIFFGRAVFPEPIFIFFSLASIYALLKWSSNQKLSMLFTSSICAALACVIKPPPGIMMLIPLLTIWILKLRKLFIFNFKLYLYFIIATLPILAWAFWARYASVPIARDNPGWNPYQISALARWGIPDAWFSSNFYIFVLRSTFSVTLTPLVAILALIGLLTIRSHPRWTILTSWAGAMLIYTILTAGAQSTHWNYQIPFIPIGALMAVHGYSYLNSTNLFNSIYQACTKNVLLKSIAIIVLLVAHAELYFVSLSIAYDTTKRLPFALEVGKIVQASVSKNGFVLLVQPGMVPVPQSYFMNRKTQLIPSPGTSIINIEDFQLWENKGATALVVVNTPYGNGVELFKSNSVVGDYVRMNYNRIADTENYQIFTRNLTAE